MVHKRLVTTLLVGILTFAWALPVAAQRQGEVPAQRNVQERRVAPAPEHSGRADMLKRAQEAKRAEQEVRLRALKASQEQEREKIKERLRREAAKEGAHQLNQRLEESVRNRLQQEGRERIEHELRQRLQKQREAGTAVDRERAARELRDKIEAEVKDKLRHELRERLEKEELGRALVAQQHKAAEQVQAILKQLQRLDDATSAEGLVGKPPAQQLAMLKSLWTRLEILHRRLAALADVDDDHAVAAAEARALLESLGERARTLLHRLNELRSNLKTKADVLAARAKAAEQAQRLEEAIALLTEAAAADPENRALVARLVAVRKQAGKALQLIWVRGQAVEASPVIQEGRSLVPLRALAEALDAEVSWDGETRTVTFTKNGNTVQLQIDSKTILYNGEERTLDVPARIIEDRTHVPLRAVAELLNADVGYDPDTGSITVAEPAPAPEAADALDDILEVLEQTAITEASTDATPTESTNQ